MGHVARTLGADVYGHIDDGATYYEEMAREQERTARKARVAARLRGAPEPPVVRRMPVVQNPPTPEALIRQLGWSKDSTWGDSMATFRSHGLTTTTLAWLIAVTEARPGLPADARWRYFCGCCWTTIRGRR
ncbi:hypothetical protein SEA_LITTLEMUNCHKIN_77 [Gordonia phage LittleMunchkin]|nr:hypothetical protein SEA_LITTLEMUNCHKIN_77 [Gordonia phage LittleMunchkin]